MEKTKRMTLEEKQDYNAAVFAESAGPSAEDMMAYLEYYAAKENGDQEKTAQLEERALRCEKAENLRATRDQRLALTPVERVRWNQIQRKRKKEEQEIFRRVDAECAAKL